MRLIKRCSFVRLRGIVILCIGGETVWGREKVKNGTYELLKFSTAFLLLEAVIKLVVDI